MTRERAIADLKKRAAAGDRGAAEILRLMNAPATRAKDALHSERRVKMRDVSDVVKTAFIDGRESVDPDYDGRFDG